eukprot:jgi/Botrbrau1/7064/Bobra.0165s0087.1
MGKEEKKKKDKKEKKRKRDDSSDDDDRKARRAEKLAKKVTKHLKKHATIGHGYVDTENPFNDANLSERFVWGKKIEKQLREGADVRELTARAERERQLERLKEIEKVKKRREEREIERAQQEEELSMLARERAVAEGYEMEKKEEEFHLDQAKARSARRLREGRARPIDNLARNLHLVDEFGVEFEEPTAVLHGLTLADLQQLKQDILQYQEVDNKDPEHEDYWEALLEVVEAELVVAVRQEEIDRARLRGDRVPEAEEEDEGGLHTALDADIHASMAGKTVGQLCDMEEGIKIQLQTGAVADPEYWQAVLRRLALHKAKGRAREIHLAAIRRAEDRVDVAAAMGWDLENGHVKEEPDEQEPGPSGEIEEGRPQAVEPLEEMAAGMSGLSPEDVKGLHVLPELEEEEEEEEEQEENVGQWSPEPLRASMFAGEDVIPEEEDVQLLELLRKQVRYETSQQFSTAALQAASKVGQQAVADSAYQAMVQDPSRSTGIHPMMRYIAEAAPQQGEAAVRAGLEPPPEAVDEFLRNSRRQLGADWEQNTAQFGGEVALESKVYWWNIKYKPRKPKYFNRVHTGYEWNKYNQTHYDHDNPPPKVVQGYKFNIFYPDLIDKAQAPEYFLEKDPQADEHGNTCILRIQAGPPYEDIAFRIINKEWEYSHKKGFKCSFERGILHLYFNFKRQRYRR